LHKWRIACLRKNLSQDGSKQGAAPSPARGQRVESVERGPVEPKG